VIGGPNPTERDQYMGKLLEAGFNRPAGPAAVQTAEAARAPRSAVAATKPAAKRAAKPAAPKPAPKREVGEAQHPAAAAEWSIQVGAFNQREAARKAAEAAARAAAPHVAEAEIRILGPASNARSAAAHRARLTGLTQSQARAACRALDAKEIDCMIVGPSADRRASNSVASAG
jgi:D-alanyl-D-alanine carboxypeptidase